MTARTADSATGVGAGARSPERLTALSDGIYAIAMTLLVLTVSVPDGLDRARFQDALEKVWPQLGAWGLSFAILASMWRDQRRILHQVRQVDTLLVRLTLAGLAAVSLLPFPASLLAEYGGREPTAVAFYAGTAALINLLHLALVLTVRRRPYLQAQPVPDHETWVAAADHAATVLVAAVSVLMAFTTSPRAGLLTWLAAIPLGIAVRRFRWSPNRT